MNKTCSKICSAVGETGNAIKTVSVGDFLLEKIQSFALFLRTEILDKSPQTFILDGYIDDMMMVNVNDAMSYLNAKVVPYEKNLSIFVDKFSKVYLKGISKEIVVKCRPRIIKYLQCFLYLLHQIE